MDCPGTLLKHRFLNRFVAKSRQVIGGQQEAVCSNQGRRSEQKSQHLKKYSFRVVQKKIKELTSNHRTNGNSSISDCRKKWTGRDDKARNGFYKNFTSFLRWTNGRTDSKIVTFRKKFRTQTFLNLRKDLQINNYWRQWKSFTPSEIPWQIQRHQWLSGKDIMITPYKNMLSLVGMFFLYRYSVLRHISCNTHSLFLLDSVYPSMFLNFSRACCCFAKLREAMDGTFLKMRSWLLWECCIWVNTVDL